LVAPMADRAGENMRVSFKKTRWPSQLIERIDRIAADLNVVLLIFAVGLATLDLTFMVTQKVVDRLRHHSTKASPSKDRLADAYSTTAGLISLRRGSTSFEKRVMFLTASSWVMKPVLPTMISWPKPPTFS
jgi:hypothetical protein